MSLPTTKPAQLSIRSFFQTKNPTYAPPPASKSAIPSGGPPSATKPAASPVLPPPPAASVAPPSATLLGQKQQTNDEETVASPKPDSTGFDIPPLPASLPREACIRPVTGGDVNALRRINALLLPVSYPDHFYQRAIDPANSGPFSRVITWAHDGTEPKVVGGVVCRVEPALMDGKPNDDGNLSHNIYIQSLCLLSPYRSMGLINAAVDNIIATAVADPELNVTNITAHVWTENEEGLKWYKGRGFQQDDAPIRGYYMKLRPDSAWLVRRPISAAVRNALPSKTTSTSPPPQRSVPPSTTASIVNLPPMSGPPRAANAPPLPRGQSYQNQRADTEWNDLPDDMATGRLRPPRGDPDSSASSRSSSTQRKKRDRAYPVAAFQK